LAPKPTGQFTEPATPTRFFHSGDSFARKSTKMYVVPDPSERCTTVMSVFGRLTPSFNFAILLSFHFVMLPRKMSARRGPVNLSSADTPGRL
jgi:hypothetical protein